MQQKKLRPIPDLQTALQQVLRQVREETKHDAVCELKRGVNRTTGLRWPQCDCTWQERVEAEQARRLTEAFEHGMAHSGVLAILGKPEQALEEGRQAAIRSLGAAQQERGSA